MYRNKKQYSILFFFPLQWRFKSYFFSDIFPPVSHPVQSGDQGGRTQPHHQQKHICFSGCFDHFRGKVTATGSENLTSLHVRALCNWPFLLLKCAAFTLQVSTLALFDRTLTHTRRIIIIYTREQLQDKCFFSFFNSNWKLFFWFQPLEY